ncbi:MFS transporter [Gordonia pseudamarae]|jgi:predicted MFS family arabinose efflux permease|uniref:MFS transporter n=1 Tax=Gordonia pseudamarae TaxID=2831662 RepID=A0ABX6IDY2_9ACTN|nr:MULTISPECIES: MFS transporter [Gordonia]MBD0024224.1 MFS transporter [Gordonia sp. (in: high G+C Gram-positive bacteria)]QHN24615.1 MFS transporter [Gordonia pseudamarae]QHN33546.1 MFS transporter [Gordonia pseudamarae]
MSEPDEIKPFTLTRAVTLLLAVTCGTSVAGLYYAQPLLVTIADHLNVSSSTAALLVTASQIGYTLGLMFLVPLGDVMDRRRLIIAMMTVAIAASAGAAVSPNFATLCALLVIGGITSATAMVVVPMAVGLAADSERGRVTGTVMGGLLLGILLARTVSGVIAEIGGWRLVYIVAAVALAVLAVLLLRILPPITPTASLTYPRLLRSIFTIIGREPILRGRMALGFLSMCGFALMWTSSTFLLAEEYGYSDGVIGIFGLAGAAGAVGAPMMGRLADAGHARLSTTLTWSTVLVGWGLLALGTHNLPAFVAGILVFDFGVQAAHITNQNRIYGLNPDERSRLTTAYMVTFFFGGVAGSIIASLAYAAGGWLLVCGIGAGLAAAALAIWATICATVERAS